MNAPALTNDLAYSESTTSANSTNNPITVCGNGFGHGVWFTVTPTNSGRVNLTTCGSSFNTSLLVYTNTCGSLSNLLDPYGATVCAAASNPFGCSGSVAGVTFNGVSNVTYYVLAGGYDSQSGLLQITANLPVPPANDSCANAIPLTNGVPYTMVKPPTCLIAR